MDRVSNLTDCPSYFTAGTSSAVISNVVNGFACDVNYILGCPLCVLFFLYVLSSSMYVIIFCDFG